MPAQPFLPASFQTFGDLLKYLRRRERLTQLELSITVGYSEAQIGRLEKNQRRPDIAAVKALFVPALHIENEPDVIARLIELAQSARQEDAPAPGIAPYKGLLFFDESDADLFFGRETLTSHLVDRVADLAVDAYSRFLAVVGASGSGKSSLVRAGLAVTLKRAGWDVCILTPTENPLRSLSEALESPGKHRSSHALILIDQFEETFTLCRDEGERNAFIERLLNMANAPDEKSVVVIALRADFYSHCAQYPLLRSAVAAEQEYIGQMTTAELRRAIEEPAKRNGWEFESGLVDLLLNDIGAQGTSEPEPGALPLLSHALLSTWEHRRGRTFTLDGYRASGGVRGAIAETAESVFADQLNQAQQELARDVFLRLTELGEGTEDTRRRAALNEISHQTAEAAQLRAVLNVLAEARLITLNEDSAEVAHEALIREWHRLHEWLTQDREGLRLHRHITEAAREWQSRGNDPAELYRGARLAQAQEWVTANSGRLNALESAFVEASIERERHDELEKEARRQREVDAAKKLAETEKQAAGRLRRTSYTLSAVLVLLAVMLGVAWNLRQVATRSESVARSRELAAASANSLDSDPELGMLLALEALSLSETREAEEALHRAVMESHLLARWGVNEMLYSVAYHPDKTRLVTAGQDGVAKVWNVSNGKTLFELKGHSAEINQVAFSPDGKWIATASTDSTARIWDAENGSLLFVLIGHTARVNGLAFSPDGKRLATVSEDTTLRIWNVETGASIFVGPERTEERVIMTSVAFSPDGTQLATAGISNLIEIWDGNQNEPVDAIFNPTFEPIFSLAFGPDGKTLVSSSGRLARVWDLTTKQNTLTLSGHTNGINAIVFNSDGSKIATCGLDRKILVWDSSTGQLLATLSGHRSMVNSVAFGKDDMEIASVSSDGDIRIWDIGPARELYVIDTPDAWSRIALSPDGKWMAEGVGMSVKIWDVATGVERVDLPHSALVNGVTFSPDGKRIAAAADDGRILVWEIDTKKIVFTLEGHAFAPNAVSFSPDGKILVSSGGEDNLVKMWDAESGSFLLDLTGHAQPVTSVAFSPDGAVFASGGVDNVAILWNGKTGERLRVLSGHDDTVWGVAFSPDGKKVVTASRDATVRVWETETGKLLLTLKGHTNTVITAIFSPDGSRIASASLDGMAYIWDAETGEVALGLPPDERGIGGVGFTPDGTRLITASAENVRVYLLDIQDLIALAKLRLTRSLTTEECQAYLHLTACP